jgi:3'-5' exoribonuclease
MKKIMIRDLQIKENVETQFLIKYMAIMEARDGKKYLNVILNDASGDLEARIWQNAEETMEQFSKGNYVQVSGKLNLFQGRKQFVIKTMTKLSAEDVNTDDFIIKAAVTPEIMYDELLEIVADLDDVYIKELLELVLGDEEIQRRLKLWQAGKSIHHAYQSGLLEHILSCTNLAVSMSKHYNCNANYVVAGAILHDMCKIYELTDGVSCEYTEEGKLIGHLVKGLEVVDRFAYKVKGFPYQTKMHLKHILLSHHGEYAYGSPKIPQTSEAMLVHLIDMMDSKMNAFETIKQQDQNMGRWSNFVRHLDRIIYKDDLPFFPEKVENSRDETPSKGTSKTKQKSFDKEIKQSLGDKLKDFKVK